MGNVKNDERRTCDLEEDNMSEANKDLRPGGIADLKNGLNKTDVDPFEGTKSLDETCLHTLTPVITVVKEVVEDVPHTVSFLLPTYNGMHVVDPRDGSIVMGEADYKKVDYVCLDSMPIELQGLINEYLKLVQPHNGLATKSKYDRQPSKRTLNMRKKCVDLLKSLLYVEQAAIAQEEEMVRASAMAMARFEAEFDMNVNQIPTKQSPASDIDRSEVITVGTGKLNTKGFVTDVELSLTKETSDEKHNA